MFSLSKIVGRIGIESHDTDRHKRGIFLRNDLGRIEHVESKGQGLILVDDLQVELPLGIVARLDGVEEILSVIVGILTGSALGLVPNKTGFALLRLPVPLDQLGRAIIGNESVCVYTKAVLSSRISSRVPRKKPYHIRSCIA